MRKKEQEPGPLKLLFVGDVMLGRLVNDVLKAEPPAYPWGDTLRLFQDADVRLCNLECVISDRGTPWVATPKVFHFRSDAKNVAVLNAAHIDIVSLANNHVLDFNDEALLDMLRLLKQAGIRAVGAGATFREASEPIIWEVQGRKLGVIACTDNEPDWGASGERPGVWYVPLRLQDERARQVFEIVQRTKAAVAYLIVSIHWGPNWGYAPPPEHQPFAHALIEHGADMIFGHSGHVVRGVELYQNKPIIYCAGDFIDDYAVDAVERNDQSFLFLVELSGATLSRLSLYPTVIRDFQASCAKNEEAITITTKMRKLCMQLKTDTRWNEEEVRLEMVINDTHGTETQ